MGESDAAEPALSTDVSDPEAGETAVAGSAAGSTAGSAAGSGRQGDDDEPEAVESDAPPSAPAVAGIVSGGDATLGDLDELAKELVALKEKHNAGSRLEACLRELEEQRRRNEDVVKELEAIKLQLADATRRAEEAEAAVNAS